MSSGSRACCGRGIRTVRLASGSDVFLRGGVLFLVLVGVLVEPLAQRYKADRMFDIRRIHGTMSTYTMDARSQLIHNEKYCQLFGNKQFFVEAYPIKKKSDFHLGLYKFVKEYGAPDKMTYDGAQEQIVRKT